MIISEQSIKDHFENYSRRYSQLRTAYKKPLTLAEKILFSHLSPNQNPQDLIRGKSFAYFKPDRVIMQDATAQMAMLQFMQSQRPESALPTSIHCDHLIIARRNALLDIQGARSTNKEIYDFLLTASQKYGIDFWEPGAGIIHQVALENYSLPGLMTIGTDSHTPNSGGISSLAIGVGGADAVDVMVGLPWELLMPKLMGVKLTGKLSPWCSPKDIILKLAGLLTVKGGTGYVIEYFGSGVSSLSCTGRATICNMGAEVGATTSLFPYDSASGDYLKSTERMSAANLSHDHLELLCADQQILDNPEQYYDKIIELNLDDLEPHINGPYSPDWATPISEFKQFIKTNKFPSNISAALIGSCTNSSFEDLSRVHSILKFAQAHNLELKSPFWLSPGSESIYKIIESNGFLSTFNSFGTHVLANACGPCIGQWDRSDIEKEETNSIISSFNRNFAKRADGNPNTHSFVASPEIVSAMGLAGTLLFNPCEDTITNKDGKEIRLTAPQSAASPPTELLKLIFGTKPNGLISPPEPSQRAVHVVSIDPSSDRLQVLSPFDVWDKKDFKKLHLLIKTKGKCTTDHISMAGPWLKYRGHLEQISQNMLIGAVNAFTDKTNSVINQLTNSYDNVPDVAVAYRDNSVGSIVVGGDNYGEGSSREHAAMEPRFMGVKIVIVKSFARIHETNLKKQGILPLTFANPDDYDLIQELDRIDVLGLTTLSPNSKIRLILHHKNTDGSTSTDEIIAKHSLNKTQIEWFQEGSSLNVIKNNINTT